jgi:hypothetical protein
MAFDAMFTQTTMFVARFLVIFEEAASHQVRTGIVGLTWHFEVCIE